MKSVQFALITRTCQLHGSSVRKYKLMVGNLCLQMQRRNLSIVKVEQHENPAQIRSQLDCLYFSNRRCPILDAASKAKVFNTREKHDRVEDESKNATGLSNKRTTLCLLRIQSFERTRLDELERKNVPRRIEEIVYV